MVGRASTTSPGMSVWPVDSHLRSLCSIQFDGPKNPGGTFVPPAGKLNFCKRCNWDLTVGLTGGREEKTPPRFRSLHFHILCFKAKVVGFRMVLVVL